MTRTTAVTLCLLLVLASGTLLAQQQSSALEGVIKDTSGAVLPGVTLEATSRGIGVVVTTTDSSGIYRFPRLPIGIYTLSASLSGYKTAQAADIDLVLGRTVTVNLTLQLNPLSEEITVTAVAPLVDVTQSGTATSIAREQLELLPKGRDFASVVGLAPGASNEPFLAGISIDGASGAENRYVIDGVDTTHPQNGTQGQGFITDFLEEVQVKTAGYAAEFGGSVGGVITAVTNSGGNDLAGWVGAYYSDARWDGEARPAMYESAPGYYFTFPKDQQTTVEPGFALGGPVLRDQMWFYLGYSPTLTVIDRVPVSVTGSRGPVARKNLTTSYYLANLKGNIGSKLLYKAAANFSPIDDEGILPNIDNSTAPTADLSVRTKSPKSSYSVYGDFLPSSVFYVSARAGKYSTDIHTSGVDAPYRIAFSAGRIPLPATDPRYRPTPFSTVPQTAFDSTDYDQWDRQTAAFDGNLFAAAIGQHALKGGVQYERITNQVSAGEAGNFFGIRWGLADAFGAGVRGNYGALQVRRFRTEGGATSTNLGFYVQDGWQIRTNLIVNAGVRTDRERVPNYGRKRDPTLPEWAIEFDYGKKIAPRIGLAWDVLANQRLKVYGSYGTYYDITKLQTPRSAFGGEKWVGYFYPLNTLNWQTLPDGCHISRNDLMDNPCPALGTPVALDLRSPTDPREGIDPDLEPMEQREFQLGAEVQAAAHSTVGLRYVSKKLINAIEDIGFLVEIAPGVFAEQYIQGNPGKGIVAGDPPGPVPAQPTAKRNYDAIELTVHRPFKEQWSLRATYTYSRLVGNYSGLASSDEFGRAEPNIERYFDALHNAFNQNGREVVGVLNTDRSHAVEAQALYRTPWGTTAGVNSSWRSGTPVSEEVSYIGVPFFPHGRGNKGRTPNLTQTDLLLTHPINFSRYHLVMSLNVLNLFDEKTATRIGNSHYRADLCDAIQCNRGAAQQDFFSRVPMNVDQIMAGQPVNPYYLKPLAWQSPRWVRVGVKLLF